MHLHLLKAPKGNICPQTVALQHPQPGRRVCFQANKARKSSSLLLYKSYDAAKLTFSPCYFNAS